MSVDDLEQAKTLIQAHRKFHTILKNMAFWQSEVETIEQLTHAIESLFPGRFASVLLFNAEHSTLHMSGAHTSLPKSFTDKVEGTKIGPKNGSCGAAIYFKKPYIVEDTLSHENWRYFRDEIESAGLRACWAMPILAKNERVLGSFAIYSPTILAPSAIELEILETAAHVASVALDKKQLVKAACSDHLTSLHNRSHFEQSFEHLLSIAERNAQAVGLVFMDLNKFKRANDEFGHEYGDQLLKLVGRVLQEVLRSTDISCRYGGDEFLFACIDVCGDKLAYLCRRIAETLREETAPEVTALGFGVSFGGIVIPPEHNFTITTLIKEADKQMYMAKKQGRLESIRSLD